MYIRSIILMSVVLFYSGCTSKNEIAMEKSLSQMGSYGKEMQKTEKLSITDNGEVKVFLTATYLNGKQSVEDEKNQVREKFIIGLYQTGDINTTGLINKDQNITINVQYPKSDKAFTKAEKIKRSKGMEKLPTLVKKLTPNDPLLKNIPMVNSWSEYYYVEFPHTQNENFALTYQNKIYGKIPLKNNNINKTAKNNKTKEKKEIQQYKKYKMYFSKKYKYLSKGKVNLFGAR